MVNLRLVLAVAALVLVSVPTAVADDPVVFVGDDSNCVGVYLAFPFVDPHDGHCDDATGGGGLVGAVRGAAERFVAGVNVLDVVKECVQVEPGQLPKECDDGSCLPKWCAGRFTDLKLLA